MSTLEKMKENATMELEDYNIRSYSAALSEQNKSIYTLLGKSISLFITFILAEDSKCFLLSFTKSHARPAQRCLDMRSQG